MKERMINQVRDLLDDFSKIESAPDFPVWIARGVF